MIRFSEPTYYAIFVNKTNVRKYIEHNVHRFIFDLQKNDPFIAI